MSSGDGFSMLKKMREEELPLWVIFVEQDRKEYFDSKVLDLTGDKLFLAKYEVAAFRIDLEGAAFGFADPRESTDPEKIGKTFEWCLALSWPNGARCRLFVLRG